MSELNRYQNPEVFEKLAMAYAAGTLHGRARQRFESLKDQHFYLEATTNAYEGKFGSLVELLPDERPSDRVWENIQSSIQTEAPAEQHSWFSWLNPVYSALAATTMAVALAIFLVTPGGVAPVAYAAVLEDTQSNPVAITRITSDLSVSIDIVKDIKLADGEVLKLWCHPKGGGKPMEMGKVAKSGKTTITITPEEWVNMASIGKLEISSGSHGSTPNSKRNIILEGSLNRITNK